MGLFGSDKRSRNAAAVVTGAGSGIGAGLRRRARRRAAARWCAATSTTTPPQAHRRRDHRARAARPWPLRCDVSSAGRRVSASPTTRSAGSAVPDPGRQQRRRRRRRHRRSARRRSTTGAGRSASTCGARSTAATCSRRSCARPARAASSTSPRPRASPRRRRWGRTTSARPASLSLSETLAAELAGTGVHVTVLCPTFVKTNILERRADHRAVERRWPSTLDARHRHVARAVARTCLDTHDRGGLYVVPQLDAKFLWHLKRHAPTHLHPRAPAC